MTTNESKYTYSEKVGAHANQPLLTIRADDVHEFLEAFQQLGLDAQGRLALFGGSFDGSATATAIQNLTNAGLDPSVLPENQPAPTPIQEPAYQPPQQYGAAPQPPAQAAPWGAQQSAPAQSVATFQTPQCVHGARQHREGIGKNGPWKAWFCPTPKGTPGQCDGIFQSDRNPNNGYVAPIGG